MTGPVITISRQYGSGGRFIGRKLAEKLGIPFYDNELISLAAKESGFAESLFENAEKNTTYSLLYSLSMFGTSTGGMYGLSLSDKVFLIQSDIIKSVAEKGPCVIVGRCADYVLRENDNVLHFFMYSDIENRINRAIKYYGLDEKKAKEAIEKTDKKRAAYYNYYTGERWGEIRNYHMSLNTDSIGVDNCVEVLAKYVDAFKSSDKQ
ncbi:MAG: cytidylate kinase-like family protein [Ruminococcaceae bacterium]|nr:cytidylate kinase-like family protein [Oscillospiraceae bacterium]